jgi:hypothetical protein
VKDIISKEKLYMSPEAYRAAKFGRPHGGTFNLTKSDVFSNGLVVLEAGLMREMPEIYNNKNGEGIDVAALESNIREFEGRYPDNTLLHTTVRKMLEIKVEERPDFKEIKKKLPEYKLVKKYFKENPDSLPDRRPYSTVSNPYLPMPERESKYSHAVVSHPDPQTVVRSELYQLPGNIRK